MVRALKNLNYLDDRPVYEYERLIADAFARGGEEEEAKVKQEMQDKKAAEENAKRAFGKEHNEKGKKFRKDMFKKMAVDENAKKNADEVLRALKQKRAHRSVY